MRNQQIIRLNSHKQPNRNNNYYALETYNPINKKEIVNLSRSKSGSSRSARSPKGISLSKDLKKSFEHMYFGIPMQQTIKKPQPIIKQIQRKTINKPLSIVFQRARSIQPKITRTIHYQYPMQYQIAPLVHKISAQTSSQTEQSCCSSSIQKNSGHLSTAVQSKQAKDSRCHSQEMSKSRSLLGFNKPTSAFISTLQKKSCDKKVRHPLSQSSLGLIPISESIYIQTSVLNEYFQKNKQKIKEKFEQKKN